MDQQLHCWGCLNMANVCLPIHFSTLSGDTPHPPPSLSLSFLRTTENAADRLKKSGERICDLILFKSSSFLKTGMVEVVRFKFLAEGETCTAIF